MTAVVGMIATLSLGGIRLEAQRPTPEWQAAPWVSFAPGVAFLNAACDCVPFPTLGVQRTFGVGVYLRPELSIGLERTGYSIAFDDGLTKAGLWMLSTQVSPFDRSVEIRLEIGRSRFSRGSEAFVDNQLTGQLGVDLESPLGDRRGSQVAFFLHAFRSQKGPPVEQNGQRVRHWLMAISAGINFRIGLLKARR